MNEKNVKNAVCDYFNGRLFRDFSVHTDDREPNLCAIHFGSTRNGTADVILRNTEKHFVAIVECKAPNIGNTDAGKKQLASYLNSTGTRFGILAYSVNSDDWIFAENLGGNKFKAIDKPYFEEHVFDPPTIEWTQQNVLKWKSEAEQWESKAHRSTTISKILAPLVILLTIALTVSLFRNSSPLAITNGFANRNDLYQVLRIIDGDTVEIEYEGTLTSVQLIGVNAPETVHPRKPVEPYGMEATAFLRNLVLNRFVYFEFDGAKKDKYDRLLAYVYRDSDDLFVNVEVIRQGFARTETRFPFKHLELFKYHESHAYKDGKGLWFR